MVEAGYQVYKGKNKIGIIERVLMPDIFIVALYPSKKLEGDVEIAIFTNEDETYEVLVRTYPHEPSKVKIVILCNLRDKSFRKHTRLRIHTQVDVHLNKKEEAGSLVDISCGGLRFIHKDPIVLGKKVELLITFPEETLTVKGDIVGQMIKPKGFSYNLKFDEPLEDEYLNSIVLK